MSWTLRPTYYKTNFHRFDKSQTDMLLFSSYRGYGFDFSDLVFGPQTMPVYRLYFYYDVDAMSHTLEKIVYNLDDYSSEEGA